MSQAAEALQHVSLSYPRTGLDWVTIALSLIGIGLCIRWRREGDLSFGTDAGNEVENDAELLIDDAGEVATSESGVN